MLLTLPGELQADVFSLCDSSTLVSLACVSRHVRGQAIHVLYKRPVTISTWSSLLGLFSLPPPSSYASSALAFEYATTRRAELELIRTLILDFPSEFEPPPPPDFQPGAPGAGSAGGRAFKPPKRSPSPPVFGPIPKLLALRSKPLHLENVIVAHIEPIDPIAPLLQCLNPVYFGTFASGYTCACKLFDELNWRVYATFGLKAWTRLERWSFGPRRSYVDDAGVGPAHWICSSPFKAAAPLAQPTVHLETNQHNAENVLEAFRAVCPKTREGKAVKVLVPTQHDKARVERLRASVVADETNEEVRRWWQTFEIETGGREWSVDGRTVWPQGLLPT